MNDQELKELYNQYVDNGGKLSFSKWKQRKYEQMLKDREEAINKKRASILEHNEYNSLKQNPIYEKINNILGENTDYFDAQSAINRARRDGIIETNEELANMKGFLDQNEGLFYNNDGDRILYSKAEDLFDVDSELKKFTNNYDKEHNIHINNEAESATKQKIKKSTEEAIDQITETSVKESEEKLGESAFKKIFNKRSFGVIMNTGFAISDYKDARNQGNSVIKSAAKAGSLFVAGEVLQGAMLPVILAKQMPSMIVSGVDSLQKITRQMNSSQRLQTFSEAQFQDTQQLATMRQAGMEMAKMSQYNLQQSIMGNEAQFLHRI